MSSVKLGVGTKYVYARFRIYFPVLTSLDRGWSKHGVTDLEAQDIETFHHVNDAGQSHCKFIDGTVFVICHVVIANVWWGFH